VADAFQHCKFIGHSAVAEPLLDKAGIEPDPGIMSLTSKKDVDAFVGALGALRLWDREPKVKLQPEPPAVRGRPASAAAR
jgi:catalase